MTRARISCNVHVFVYNSYTSQTLQLFIPWLNDAKKSYFFRACLHVLAFFEVKPCIKHILNVLHLIRHNQTFFLHNKLFFLPLAHNIMLLRVMLHFLGFFSQNLGIQKTQLNVNPRNLSANQCYYAGYYSMGGVNFNKVWCNYIALLQLVENGQDKSI